MDPSSRIPPWKLRYHRGNERRRRRGLLEWSGMDLWHFMKFWGTRRARNFKKKIFGFGHKPILDNSLTWQTLTLGTSMEFTICALCKRGEEEEKSISAPYQKAFAHLGMHEIRGLPLSTRLSIQQRPNRSPRTPKPQREGVGSRAGQILCGHKRITYS